MVVSFVVCDKSNEPMLDKVTILFKFYWRMNTNIRILCVMN